MPKPTALTPEALTLNTVSPPAAMKPRSPQREQPKPDAQLMPLQVRWPREEVRAVKVASAEHEQTVSDFLLACYRTCKQNNLLPPLPDAAQ